MDTTKEYILCAAIWYKGLENHIMKLPGSKNKDIIELYMSSHRAANIHKGIVVYGYRHNNIINQVLLLTGRRTVTVAEDATGSYEQGFLTSKNRFVDRTEAMQIAKACNQVGDIESRDLYSEDIY